MDDIKQQFLSELPDALEEIMVACDKFASQDPGEHIQDFLRKLHSLKGSAQSADEDFCADICHELETRFPTLGPQNQAWNDEEISLVFKFLNLITPASNLGEAHAATKKEFQELTQSLGDNEAEAALPDLPEGLLPTAHLDEKATWFACIGISGLTYKMLTRGCQSVQKDVIAIENVKELVSHFQKLGPPAALFIDHQEYDLGNKDTWIQKILTNLKAQRCPQVIVGSIENLELQKFTKHPNALLAKNHLIQTSVHELMIRWMPSTPPSPSTATPSVLFVEDNPINTKLGQKVLTKLGYEVDTAKNGIIALAKSLQQHYDLILMDLEMPKMGGLEACSQMRKKGIQSPIIAMTAHTNSKIMEICKTCGMNDGLSKPIKKDKLIRDLKRLRAPLPEALLDET